MLKKDHEGVPVAKIVYWGTTMAGKTTALTIIKVLKSLEDPSNVYKFLKLEDPTGRTLFFDQAIFGIGKDSRGLPLLKYHVYTTPGQDRHVSQRKVVLRGAHGLIIVIDSDKTRWDDNKRSLMEINDLAGDLLANGSLPYYILLNKMDLPADQRISALEVGKLLVEAGAASNLKDAAVRVVEASCIHGSNDLKALLTENPREAITDEAGLLKKSVRPKSVQRVVKPLEFLVREIVVNLLKQAGG
ncbi:MAG: hypothetical protein ACTSP4_08900 [Candidatus Hodarchaeales archaeon]